MGCCGQRRRALRTPTQSSGSLPSGSWVHIEYRSQGRVAVRGVTGRTYVFSDTRRIQAVHARDARALLRTPGFRLL